MGHDCMSCLVLVWIIMYSVYIIILLYNGTLAVQQSVFYHINSVCVWYDIKSVVIFFKKIEMVDNY